MKTLPGVQPLPDRVDVAHGMGVDRSVGQMTASRAGAGYIFKVTTAGKVIDSIRGPSCRALDVVYALDGICRFCKKS